MPPRAATEFNDRGLVRELELLVPEDLAIQVPGPVGTRVVGRGPGVVGGRHLGGGRCRGHVTASKGSTETSFDSIAPLALFIQLDSRRDDQNI